MIYAIYYTKILILIKDILDKLQILNQNRMRTESNQPK